MTWHGLFLYNLFYYYPCHGERCQRRFKRYVKSRFPDPLSSLGVASSDGIRIPNIEGAEPLVTDRLHQALSPWRTAALPEL